MAASPRRWISRASAAMRCAASRSIDIASHRRRRAARRRSRCDRAAGLQAVPRRRLRRHGRYRRDRRSRRAGALCREEGLWFHVDGAFGALGDSVAGARAAACRNRAGRFDRARFPQMGAGALRRRLPAGARRRAAPRQPSPRRRRICAAKRGGSPRAHRGRAISGPICRAASAR